MKVTVIGGAGAVGSVAARTLAGSGVFDEIVLADANVRGAEAVADELGPSVRAVRVDAGDEARVARVVGGSRVVLNTAGPFYRYGPPVLGAVTRAGIDYVDVCDDEDATEKVLAMDDEVRALGVTALVGMGSSPGVANVVARFAAETLLDSVESVDIYHAHGGESSEGRAVVAHRIHSMLMDIPVFLDGRFQTVRLFEESGRALEEEVEFEGLGTFPVYAYPHPETLTLPRHLEGVRRVTNLGVVLPPAYAELIKDVVRLGVTSTEPIYVGRAPVSPLEFAISFILSRRERLTREAGFDLAQGCLKVVVRGRKEGAENAWEFSLHSRGRGMGEGTGIPAALGAILMATGKIEGPGVRPPEAAVRPADLFGLIGKTMREEGAGLPVTVRRIVDGEVETLDVSALFG